MSMRPVSAGAAGAHGLPRAWPREPAGTGRLAARARSGAVRGHDVAGPDGPAGASLEQLLGRVPARSARGFAALLPPPPGRPPQGLAQAAAALRRSAARARAAGGAADDLAGAAAAVPGGAALQAAVEQERRLGEALQRLGALQDQVTAAMTAVVTG
jgi:hypothetical protein